MSFDPLDSEHYDAADAALLASFVRQRSEGAFAELVRRHAGWVQGVAKRALGDGEAARDAAQEVFILLARKAGGIRGDALGPWLHRTTVLVCRNAGRREAVRRRALPELSRHMEAMHTPSPDHSALREALPLLDAAVDALPAGDRTLVVQRFMENRSWREIGADMGRSEDAARMALQPALERLSALLRKRGIAVPLSAFAALFACGGASDAAAASLLAQRALAMTPVTATGRLSHAAWWSAAACLAPGAATGWTLGAPEPAAIPKAASPLAAPARTVAATSPGAENGEGFDLDAILSALRSLQATGNDPAVVAQLAGALVDMPPTAVAPVVQVLRTRRWGEDTQRVAQACFHRWAQLDNEVAWREVFAPDFLGAAVKTASAVIDALPPGNPERLVVMFNGRPQNTASSAFGYISLVGGQRDIDLLREHFSGLSGEESAPLIAQIEKDQLRSFALSGAPKATAADCAALAPLAAALPPSEQSGLMHVVERWAVLDTEACAAYVKSLPPRTPAANMGLTSFAKVLAQRDPAAAAQLISGLPWNAHCYWQMEAVAKAWLKADPEAARRWLEAEPYVEHGTRKRLIKDAAGIHESDSGEGGK